MEAETEISEQPVENEEIIDGGEEAAIESEPTTVTTQSDVPELEEKSPKSEEKMEIANVEPTYSLEDMEEIRKWWEIPCVAHFCSLFRAAFDLPDFDIEELEEALLASGTPEGSMLMCDLISQLLNGCYGRNDIKAYNFEVYLKDIFKKRSAIEGAPPNPLEESSFQMLPVRTKLELLQELSDFRLDAEDVQDLLKGLDGDNLRVEPMGRDQHGATYWYFYGVRLYKEDPELKPEEKKNKTKRKPREKKEKEVKKSQSKQKPGRKKRRGRPAKSKDSTPSTPKTPVTPGRKGRRGRPPKQKPQEEVEDKAPEKEETIDAENDKSDKVEEEVKVEADTTEVEEMAKGNEEDTIKEKDEVVKEAVGEEKKENSEENSEEKEAENVESMDHDGDEKESVTESLAETKPTPEQAPARRSSRIRTPVVPLIPSDDEDQMDVSQDETPRRNRRINRKARATRKDESSEEEEEEEEEEDDNSDTEIDEPKENGKEEGEVPLSTLNKEPVAPNRWHLVCQSLEDWEALAESFKESKVRCEKTMYRTIVEDFLPEIPRILEEKERDMKRRALENAPRRTSGRLEEKQKQREEEEKLLAAQQAEEDKMRQEEEEARRKILEVEKLEIQRRQREEREKQRERMREEREKAVERRAKRAALREEKVRLLAERERLIAEGIELPPELQNLDANPQKDEEEDDKMDAEKEELYSSMRKILYTIKAHEDSWPFWEPVKEEFAPDYFKYITTPMDLITIERKLDDREYSNPHEFGDDFQLLFDNCEKYNGENSDFTYMARTLEKIVKMRLKKFQPKRVERYDVDDDFTPEDVSFSPGRPRSKRQTAYSARENIHAVLMDQDEDGEDSESSKSKYTIIYPALKSRGDDMRTAEGQARFLQALQAAKRREAAEEVRHSGEKPQRSLMVQTNTITIPKHPGRASAVDDPVKGIIVQNNKNRVQLLSKTVSVTSRYNGQKQDDEDPELASLPMHKRIKEREAQKAKLKLGEPKAEPMNDFISVVRRSEVSRLYSGLIQKTAKHASPQKHQTDKAANSPNISPKVVHISLDDFKRLQSQQAKVIVVPSRDKDKSGTVIHLSTGSCSTSIGSKKAESLVNKVKEEQSAKQAQGVVESEDVNVLEHSDDKVTVLKTTPVKSDEGQESSLEVESKTSEQETETVNPKEVPMDVSVDTSVDTSVDISDKVESSPEACKVKNPVSDSKTYAKSLKPAKMSSVATSTPKRAVRSQKKTQGEEVKSPPIPKTIINLRKKTALQSTEKKKDETTPKGKSPKTIMKKKAVVAEKAEEESPPTTPKTIIKGKRPALKTPESEKASKATVDNDSGTPRKKLRKSVSWSKNLTTESPYVPPPATKEGQTSTPISTRKPPTLYKDGIHSRIPRMHRAPIQAPKTQEPPVIGAEKTIVNGMIVSKSMLHSAPVIKTYSKKEPELKRSYESDFFVEAPGEGAPREPSPPKLTRIEQIEGSVSDHSEEAPPDIVSDHEKDDGQLSDSETVIQLSTDALRQTEITKLHTTLFTYTGTNQRQKKPKSPIKPVDDENTCAKVVRRTKRRLASPLLDSTGIRKPGRPANLISYDSQITMDRMDAAKVRRSGPSRARQLNVQEPVLDMVSESDMVEEQEQKKMPTRASPSKRLKKLRSRGSKEKQEDLKEDTVGDTEMQDLETEDQEKTEVNTDETDEPESLAEKEKSSIHVQSEPVGETENSEEVVDKSTVEGQTDTANEKSVEQDMVDTQDNAGEKIKEQTDQPKSIDKPSKYEEMPEEHSAIEKVAVNILTGEEEIIEEAEQHEEEAEEEQEDTEEEKETSGEIEDDAEDEEMEENQDEEIEMEDEEQGPPELTAETETLEETEILEDKKTNEDKTMPRQEPGHDIEDAEEEDEAQIENEELNEEELSEKEEEEIYEENAEEEENVEVEIEEEIEECELEPEEMVDEEVEETAEKDADGYVESKGETEQLSYEKEELSTEEKTGSASDEEIPGDEGQEVFDEEEDVESPDEEVEDIIGEDPVEQIANGDSEKKDHEKLVEDTAFERKQTADEGITILSIDKHTESECKLEEGSQGEERVEQICKEMQSDNVNIDEKGVTKEHEQDEMEGEENLIEQQEEDIDEEVDEQDEEEREEQQEEEKDLHQMERHQHYRIIGETGKVQLDDVEMEEECKLEEETAVEMEEVAGQSGKSFTKSQEDVSVEDSASEEQTDFESEKSISKQDLVKTIAQVVEVTEAEVVEESESEIVATTEEAEVLEATDAVVVEATDTLVVEETMSDVVEKTNSENVAKAEPEIVEATEAVVVEETISEVVEGTEAEDIEETESKIIATKESEAFEATEKEVVEETNAEVVEATEAGVDKTTEKEVVETTEVIPVATLDEHSDLQKVENTQLFIADGQSLKESDEIVTEDQCNEKMVIVSEEGNEKQETFQDLDVEMNQVHEEPPALKASVQHSEVIAEPSCEVENHGSGESVDKTDLQTDTSIEGPTVEQASPLSVSGQDSSNPVCEDQSDSIPVTNCEDEMLADTACKPVACEVADVVEQCEELVETVDHREEADTVGEDDGVVVEDVEMVEECVVEDVETEEALSACVSVPGEPLHSEGTENQGVELVQGEAEMHSLHSVSASEVTVAQDTMVNDEVPMDTDCTETVECDNVIHQSDQTDLHVETGASSEVPRTVPVEDSNPPLLEKVGTELNPASESGCKSDVSLMPSISEPEQSQTVNGEQSVSNTCVVSDQTNNSSDFRAPSGDPVKRSCKSPVCSPESELSSQNQSPPKLSTGTSPNTSPNTSPSKGGVDRNLFSELASNVNSETKTSPSSSPGKTSPTTLNLPRGFAASLNKLKFKLPAANKSTEDNLPEGSS